MISTCLDWRFLTIDRQALVQPLLSMFFSVELFSLSLCSMNGLHALPVMYAADSVQWLLWC